MNTPSGHSESVRTERTDFSRGSAVRGWHLFEMSIAIIAVATFLVGVSDVVRIFHARTAIRQGVADGLRCLYPTAESCTTEAAGGLEMAPPLYRAMIRSPSSFQYLQSDYLISSSWRTEPIQEARYTQRKLSTLEVRYKQEAYREYAVRFPVAAHSLYLIQTRYLPWVELAPDQGQTARERVLRARFKDRTSGTYLSDLSSAGKVISLSSIKGTTSSERPVQIGEVSFDLSDAWPSREEDLKKITEFRKTFGYKGVVPCYQDSWKQGVQGPTVIWKAGASPATCRYQNSSAALFNGEDLQVPVMLKISGDRYDTRADSRGVVSATLTFERDGKVETVDLGGRAFRADSTIADFVTRGVGSEVDAASEYFSVCRDQADYTECAKYSALSMIPRGARVRLQLYLRRTSKSGSVGWAGDSVTVFYPRFQLAHERQECGSSLTPHQCERAVSPMQPSLTVTESVAGITSEPASPGAHSCLRSAPAGSYPSQSEAIAVLKDRFAAGQEPLGRTIFVAKTDEVHVQCEGERKLFNGCEDQGVTTLKGCEPKLQYSQAELLEKCRVSDFSFGRDEIVATTYADVALLQREQRAACSEQPFPECARADLKPVGEKILTASDAICSDAITKQGAQWLAGRRFDVVANAGCPDLRNELIEEYRKRNQVLPQEAQVFVSVTAAPPLVASAPPSVACQSFSVNLGEEAECAAGVPYYAAQECCKAVGGACRIEQVSAGGAISQGASWDARLARAIVRAQETVRVAYPLVRSVGSAVCGKDAKHCLQVEGEKLDNDTRVQMRASMQVPLALLGWLGLENLGVVRHAEVRTLESALAGS